IMYYHDHGEYPKSLEDLTPDYLDALPLDPYSGKDFQYLPNGLDLPLVEWGTDNGPIKPHNPLLWSVGAWYLGDFVRGVYHEPSATDTQEPPVESPAYRLGSGDATAFWGGPDHLVFPLPK